MRSVSPPPFSPTCIPASPPSTSPPPRALPPLSFLLLPPPSLVTSPGCPWPATTASSRRHRQPVARTASRDRGDPEARARLDGACGRHDRRSRGSPHGRRAGDGGTSWKQCQGHGPPLEVTRVGGEARRSGKRVRSRGGGQQPASAPRPAPAQHPQHRWRAECISSPPGNLPPPFRRPPHHPRSVSRSRRLCSMFACVRAMSCLCQLCRSSLDERLYRDMCVESCVRCAGARRCSSTSSYATYKVLTVGKVYRPSRTSSLHRRRSRQPQVRFCVRLHSQFANQTT